MEVISGENNLNVIQNESGCRFKLILQMYIGIAGCKEHDTVVKSILASNNKANEVVCDMMCGIGPFAIPLAKNGIKVYGNDLNPESYKYLVDNKKLNKIVNDKLICSNLDGREFVRKLGNDGKTFTHVLMNLPALGIEFLDVFVDGCVGWPETLNCHLYIHIVYLNHQLHKKMQQNVEKFQDTIQFKIIEDVRIVRDVAPNKLMLCAEFQLLRGDLGGIVVDVNGNNNDDDGSDNNNNNNNNKRKMDDDKYNNNNVNNNKKMKK